MVKKKEIKKKKKSTSIIKIKQLKKERDDLEKQLEILKGNGGKLTMTESPLDNNQLLRLLQRTPKEYIYTRKGKGGKMFTYVPGYYVKKSLNCIFSWLWDSEVVYSENIKIDNKIVQIIVDVKLTIKYWNKKTGHIETLITKTQTGRADVKYLRDRPNVPVDVGNDRKAAITDGVKKCASELGLASDVYATNEYRDIKKDPIDITPEKGKKGKSTEPIEPKEPEKSGKIILPDNISNRTICNIGTYKNKKVKVTYNKLDIQQLIYLYAHASNPKSIEPLLNTKIDSLITGYIKLIKDFSIDDLRVWIESRYKVKDETKLNIKQKCDVIVKLKKMNSDKK